MTKNQIDKHGETIKWFCDNSDKYVWIQISGNRLWTTTDSPAFAFNNKYVQDDEYAEYRKAQADGKAIEEMSNSGVTWYTNKNPNYADRPEHYRIKPDEPKFKVGDWTRLEDNSNWFLETEQHVKTLMMSIEDGEDIKLWKPKEGEWCVFWDDKRNANYTIAIYMKQGDKHGTSRKLIFNNIAPLEFAQTLKDN